MRQLTGQPEPAQPPAQRPPLHDWLLSWIDDDAAPREQLDSPPGVMWHLADAWARRDEPNVLLVHYDDLSADLDGEMRRLAALLGISVLEETWPALMVSAGQKLPHGQHGCQAVWAVSLRIQPDGPAAADRYVMSGRQGVPGRPVRSVGRPARRPGNARGAGHDARTRRRSSCRQRGRPAATAW